MQAAACRQSCGLTSLSAVTNMVVMVEIPVSCFQTGCTVQTAALPGALSMDDMGAV